MQTHNIIKFTPAQRQKLKELKKEAGLLAAGAAVVYDKLADMPLSIRKWFLEEFGPVAYKAFGAPLFYGDYEVTHVVQLGGPGEVKTFDARRTLGASASWICGISSATAFRVEPPMCDFRIETWDKGNAYVTRLFKHSAGMDYAKPGHECPIGGRLVAAHTQRLPASTRTQTR